MFYSLLVLQPRARAFFKDDRQFEEFVSALAHRARYKVLAAIGFIALTGVLLIPFRPHPPAWWPVIIAKIALLVFALVLFCYVSWKLWPGRIFAVDTELPGYRRQFRCIGIVLLILVGVSMALGIVCHYL